MKLIAASAKYRSPDLHGNLLGVITGNDNDFQNIFHFVLRKVVEGFLNRSEKKWEEKKAFRVCILCHHSKATIKGWHSTSDENPFC